ncbi:hypothetical protein [Actinomadura bangladeshensis]|uniref:Uncharacterized protein n=1 Tax=Actinomadura bangladeshensis TaxID=453573 RepID=A0A6L9QC95_9ACTN|nr:hypothetical protein [Actinomadura bangladeshensis]NEA22293.1 hypothetical protein [Actinomadura bangladeshensis]
MWDGHGRASAWGEPSHFEMGLFAAADWTAQWIGNAAWSAEPEPAPATPRTARYVRLDVTRLGLPIKEGWPYKVSRLQLAEVQMLDEASGVTASESASFSSSSRDLDRVYELCRYSIEATRSSRATSLACGWPRWAPPRSRSGRAPATWPASRGASPRALRVTGPHTRAPGARVSSGPGGRPG